MPHKLIGIRIMLVRSRKNASVCQSPCHVYKALRSPNVQDLSENQMEQKPNFLSFKNSTESGESLPCGSAETVLFQVQFSLAPLRPTAEKESTL